MTDPIHGAVQVFITGIFGAFASIGQLLASAKILTPRRVAASWIGGVTGGIVSGALFGSVLPGFNESYLLVAAVGSIGGAAGVHVILAYFFYKHAPEVLKNDYDADSITVKKLIESGEHDRDEIQQMIESERKKRAARKTK